MRKPIQNHSFSILIIFAALCMIGISVIPKLRLQLYPSTTLQSISIGFYWSEAATSRILEQEVCTPLEGAFSTMNGLENMTSTSNKSKSGSIQLNFRKDLDMQKVRHEVAALIRQVYPKLPEGASFPTIYMHGGGNQNQAILTYFFNGPFDINQLYNYAEDHLRNKFSDINGLADIEITGGTKTAYQLIYDQNQLNSLNISSSQIAQSIINYQQKTALGLAFTNDELNKQIFIQLNFGDLGKSFWDKIIIKNHDGHFIKLRDLCKIEQIEIEPNSYNRINGLNTVNISFKPEEGANHLMLAKKIKERIAKLSMQLPPKHSFKLASDQTIQISKELNKIISRTFITVIILLIFVLIISLSFRYLLIILISLSCNILLSFSIYAFLGIDIHLKSLAGITISLGLIIDNSIVMIDHIRNHGNKKVYLALLASTLTTIASLSIILFLPENIKVNLIDFSKIIMINLSVSLIIALWFIPALMEKIPLRKLVGKTGYKRHKRIIAITNFYEGFIQLLVKRKWILIILAILGFGLPVFKLPDKLSGEGKAVQIYNTTLGSRIYQEKIKPISDVILGGSLRLSPAFSNSNFDFNRDEREETKIILNAKIDKGIPTRVLNEIFMGFENFLATFEEIKQFTTQINATSGKIEISFKPEHEFTSFPFIIKAKLESKLIDLGGIGGSVSGVGRGFYQSIGVSENIDYQINMYGYNFEELRLQANILKDKLKGHQRVRNLSIDLNTGNQYYYNSLKDYEYVLDADPYIMSSYNRSTNDLRTYLNKAGINPASNASIQINDRSEDVKIRSKQSLTADKWIIMNSPIIDSLGIPLSALGNIQKKNVSPAIHKFNQQYKRTLGYTFVGTRKLGDKIKDKAIKEMKKELPLGYYIEETSYYGFWRSNNLESTHFIIIVILCIFMISSILFESLRQPLAIISIIPLSYIGIFLTFNFFDISFNQGGAASFVLITGLVVNSAIYIINDYNNKKKIAIEKKQSISSLKLYLKAFNAKIIPVFLTIISSILGLIPFMMLGKTDPFWYAFSGGSVGGLLFSLIVLVIYLPLFLVKRKK